MNRIIKGLGIALGCVLIASSCSEISFGDKFLGDQPESSGATTEEMFSSKINAEKVLTKAYTGLPYGLPTGSDYKLGVNILESITDLCYSFRDNISDGPVKLYYNGALSANNVPKNSAYRYGSKSDWTTIRYAWLYIENVEKVPDMTASEKSERIAEAKVLISLCYFEMLRYVGGVTWLDHYVDVNETMNFPRITFAETVELAQAIEAAGATIINTGIGWHEARIPTIATPVPRGAFSWVTRKLKGHVSLPLVTTNRINDPQVADDILSRGDADMVSMARPFLADAELLSKAQSGRADEINTCIGCNQACLDQIFVGKVTSCLVNPRACHETKMPILPAVQKKNLAVVGAGPAGLAFAINAAARGHQVTLFDAHSEIGGQFNIAKQIPGKEEFYETLRYYRRMIEVTGVTLKLNHTVTADQLQAFDETILASGIVPRVPPIDGIDHPKVLSYLDVLRDKAPVGNKVAIIGCGGIGFDTAMYLSQPGESTSQNIAGFCNEWGIDSSLQQAGGLSPQGMQIPRSPRQIVMLQRKASKPGQGLGKTTGWIHRTTLLSRGVKMIPGVSYQKIDDDGLHVVINGETQVLAVDNVVICAGQEPNRALAQPLIDSGKTVHLIGGCDVAMELDARRAIAQGTRLALEI